MKHELFPKNFIESLPLISEINNPLIVGLLKYDNLIAKNLKNQILKWFDNFPDEDKKDIAARLRSYDDREHLAAFYELMFHQFFLEDGYKIIRHPLLENKHPEYLINDDKNRPKFFFEVLTVFQNEDSAKSEKSLDLLLKEINKIEHYFYVDVEIDSWPPSNVSYKQLKQKLKSWLDSFNPSLKEEIKGKTFTYNLGGCNITFRLVPKKVPKKDFIVGCYDADPGYHGTGESKQIRNRIKSKVNKYKGIKSTKLPLVIAVCSSGEWGTSRYNIETELFGREKIVFDTKLKATLRRDFYGLLTPKPKIKKVLNTRLSAILFCKRIIDERNNRTVYDMRVYHNPYAEHPISKLFFSKLPQLIKIKEEKNQAVLKWFNKNKLIVFS